MTRSVPLYWIHQRKVLLCLIRRASRALAPPLHSPADTTASLSPTWARPASWVRWRSLKKAGNVNTCRGCRMYSVWYRGKIAVPKYWGNGSLLSITEHLQFKAFDLICKAINRNNSAKNLINRKQLGSVRHSWTFENALTNNKSSRCVCVFA